MRVQCPTCQKMYSSKGNLTTHTKAVHLNIKNFNCDQCDYTCSSKRNMNRHIRQIHDKIHEFICENCPFAAGQKSNLIRHIKICTGLRNISSGELACINALTLLGFKENIDYIHDSTDEQLTKFTGRNLRFDFKFIHHKIVLEYDGEQHFRPVVFGGTMGKAVIAFDKSKIRDALKNAFCQSQGIKLIRIPYTDFDYIFSILAMELEDVVGAEIARTRAIG